MDRRQFLAGATALFAACSAPRPLAQPARPKRRTPGTGWDAVRGSFELTDDFIHMAGMLLAAHPRPVRDAIERHRAALDANPADYLNASWGRDASDLGSARDWVAAAAAAEYLDVEPGEIALTDSTTMGLAMVYNGLKIRDDQEVLTAHWNHWATSGSLRFRARKDGFAVRNVELWNELAAADAEEMAERLRRAIKPETRVVAATWVHSVSGVRLPIAALADVVAEANRGRAEADRALLVVDGVHGFGVHDVTIADLRCDVFVAGCHKWLFGPRGTGVVWAHPDAWSQIIPTIPSFLASNDATPGRRHTPGGFHSFEHRWALPEAFAFHQTIGKSKVEARVTALAQQMIEGLAKLEGVSLRTPRSPELSGGIVTFTVDSRSTPQVEEGLRARGVIASHTPERDPIPRLSPGLLNTPEQVDEVLAAVRALG